MDSIAIAGIWRLLTWLPNFVLRRVFTQERLSELMLFDVRPRFDTSTVNLGSPASFDLWLQLINMSPFDVELDQALFKFYCHGVRFDIPVLEHMRFKSGEIKAFMIDGSINEEQAAQIARHLDSLNHASLSGVMEFNCTLHSFSKNCWQLNGIKPRMVNGNYRLQMLGLPAKS